MRTSLLLPFLVLAACGGSPFELHLSIDLGSDIDATTQSHITTFQFVVTGGETFTETLPLGRVAQSVERIVYHPLPTTKSLDLQIDGTDGTNELATGSTTIDLRAGTTSADVTLHLPSPTFDMAVPDESEASDGAVHADAATPDAAEPPDMTLVCPPKAHCYDFEGSSLPGPQQGGGNCAVVSDEAYHGTHSLHCTGTTPSYYADSPLLGGTGPVGMRAHVRGAKPVGTGVQVDYLVLGNDSNVVAIGDYSTSGEYGYAYNPSGSGTEMAFPTQTLEDSTWHCVEILYTPPSSVSFYLDGVQTHATFTNTALDSLEPALSLGLVNVPHPGTFYDEYIDDVVYGYGRQGCD